MGTVETLIAYKETWLHSQRLWLLGSGGNSISTPFQIASFLLSNLSSPLHPRQAPVLSTCQGTHVLGYLLYRCSWDVYACMHV